MQAKLRINPPNDVYEREADRVADAVMSASPPTLLAGQTGVSNGSLVQTKPAVRVNEIVQRQVTDNDLEAREEEEDLEELLQMKGSSSSALDVTREQESRVSSVRAGGQPLSDDHRSFFEPRFGYDFSGVRIHTDGQASASANELGARAYTVGRDIVFSSGEFQPGSPSGMRLLAHELTHVVQQSSAPQFSTVVQRDQAKKCPDVPAQPQSDALSKVDVFLSESLVVAETVGGKRFYLVLDPANTEIPEGTFTAVHTPGNYVDCISGVTYKWRSLQDPKAPGKDWAKIPASEYTLKVMGKSPVFEPDAAEARKKKGKGDDGKGSGDKGKGTGDKDKGDKGGGTGDQGKGDKDAGGQQQGGKGGTGTDPAAAENQKVLSDFQKKLKEAGSTGTAPPDTELAEMLKEMSEAERDDLARYLREEQAKAEAEGKAFDLKEVVKFYKDLSPSDRELLRTNLELAKSATGATELPKEVKIALDTGAETSSTQAGEKVSELNKQLGELARIHATVSNPSVKKEDLEPIDLNELPVFTDMMLLEGLLAGASSKSPEIQGIAKELTSSIAGIRDYVLEEIMWLAAELAVSTIISALLAPATGGASAALGAGRAALVLKRLNDLRKFLVKVEKIYRTVTTIRGIILKVVGAYEAYKKFKGEYDKWSTRLEALQSKLEKADIDGSEDIDAEIEKLEDQLIEELQKQLDQEGGLGSLLEHFFIPAEATEEDLKEILFNIPKGIEAFREVVTYYGSVDRTNMEDVKTLAYKGVRAGVLLYPFVGYLAMHISNELGSLMAEKDLSDRLLGIIASAADKGKKHKMPSKGDNRKKLKQVKPSKDKPKPKDADKPKDVPTKGKKTKGKDDPKDKKKADDKDKKKEDEKKKDADKKEDEDPKKKAEREEKEKKDAEWQLVVDKTNRLPQQFATDGVTKTELLKAARQISKAHKTVAGGPKIHDTANKGYWTVTIARKGVATTKATAEVLMNLKARWKKGASAVEKKVSGLPADKHDKTSVNAEIQPLKDPYGFASLRVGDRTDKRQGIGVFGTMGKGKEALITTIDDTTNMHFGTQTDPIPVHWYKQEGNYPKKIKLTIDGKSQDAAMDSTLTIKLRKTDVQVGIDMSNLVKVDTVMKRHSQHKRSGTRQADFREALKSAGYDWTGKDADHVRDLAFEGKDSFDNLWPLDSDRNRWAYTERWYKDYGIEYRDSANPRQAKVGTVYDLRDKYFKVIGFRQAPLPLGGKTDKWKSPDKP